MNHTQTEELSLGWQAAVAGCGLDPCILAGGIIVGFIKLIMYLFAWCVFNMASKIVKFIFLRTPLNTDDKPSQEYLSNN